MKNCLPAVISFIKKETVLCVALVVALITMFFVPPSLSYLSYIDFRVLALLFCLMAVIAGFQSLGIFEKMLPLLFRFAHTTRQLAMLLILSCFFLSMLVTNDVALITLVPFTILILNNLKKEALLLPIVVMQTIAANLGSMCTPIGNPQNLYLYTISNMDILKFFRIMLPLSIASLILICISFFFFPKENIENSTASTSEDTMPKNSKRQLILYCLLLVLCFGTILHLIDYRIPFGAVVITLLLTQRSLFRQIDYMLLLTFVAFFLFVGNLKNLPAVHDFLYRITQNREVTAAVLLSQVISNVPCAVLLSGFTKKITALLIGTNLGGLGTLIASMASLISFKFYCNTPNSKKLRYLGVFTIVNILFLIILYGGYRLLPS